MDFDRDTTAFQFSGGADSYAALLYMRPHWDKFTVYWCDSGDSFPETRRLAEKVSKMVPRFRVIEGRVNRVRSIYGYASDLLPHTSTPVCTYADSTAVKLIDSATCCYFSIMEPTYETMVLDGMKVLVRGVKSCDIPKPPMSDGESDGRFTVHYPIWDWSRADVINYLCEHELGEHFEFLEHVKGGAKSTPDCMRCTGWIEHGSSEYLRKVYPDVASVVAASQQIIFDEIKPVFERMRSAVSYGGTSHG